MIKLEEITKVYAMGQVDVVALDGIDLEIQRGEFISIMGPSGSGKSTLLHILGALDAPTSGRYLLEDVDIADLDDRELSRIRNRHFGFVFQSYNLFGELTAIENVMMPMMYARVPKRERLQRARELRECRDGPPPQPLSSQLSGGGATASGHCESARKQADPDPSDEPTGTCPACREADSRHIVSPQRSGHNYRNGHARPPSRLLRSEAHRTEGRPIAVDEPVSERFTRCPLFLQKQAAQ